MSSGFRLSYQILIRRLFLFLVNRPLRPPQDIALPIQQRHLNGLFMRDAEDDPECSFIKVKNDSLFVCGLVGNACTPPLMNGGP